MIKTYFINGFLDSGKTTFIKNLFEQDYFKTGERTLLLLCEEGEEEYDVELLQSRNVYLVEIDEEKDFNPEYITGIEKEIRPTRVVVEFNGMWKRKDIQFPWYWDPPIEITIFDAMVFEMYSRNMKSLVSEQVRSAAMAVFNRCDGLIEKLPSYRRNIKAVNSDISVVFEDKDGEMNPRFDEDLPYDITADEIDITEETFALFYLDAMENVERYLDKKIKLSAMVMKKQEDNLNTMILGRFVMTCCAEDLSLFGFICDFEGDTGLELDDWVSVTATVEKDYAEKYDLWYPALHVNTYKRCKTPLHEVIENI